MTLRLVAVLGLLGLAAPARAQFDAYEWTLVGGPAPDSFVQDDTMVVVCPDVGFGTCDARYVTTAPATGTFVAQLDADVQLGTGAYVWHEGEAEFVCGQCTTSVSVDVQAGDVFGFGVLAFDSLWAVTEWTGLQFIGKPHIGAVEPSLAHLDEALTITGSGFGAFTLVTIDGVPEPVLSSSPTELVIQPGPGAPGFSALAVINEGVADDALHHGLVRAPALACRALATGGLAEITLQREAATPFALLLGAASLETPLPVGQHLYGLLLDPDAALVVLHGGVTPSTGPLELALPVPDAPALAGLELHLQAWVAGAPGAPSSFSNRVSRPLGLPVPPVQLILDQPQPGYFGEDVVRLGDVDGDGVDELAIGAPRWRPDSQSPSVGRITVHSGADGTVLFSIPGHANAGYFGRDLDRLDDLDGDGLPDLLASEYGTGIVHLLSGADGRTLRTLPLPHWDVATVLDLDGDGLRDVLVGNGIVSSSEASVASSATGAVLRRHKGGPSDTLGAAVADAGDVDGDGARDYLLGAPYNGGSQSATSYVLVVSGATGQTLHTFRAPSIQHLGSAVAGPGDLDGDGHADLLIAAPTPSLPGWSGKPLGFVRLHSGADGSLIHEWLGGTGTVTPGMEPLDEGFGTSVDGVGDVNGDGVPDLVVGIRESSHPLAQEAGEARVLSGATGEVLFRIVGLEPGAFAGWNVAGLGDLDGDGTPDLAVSEWGISEPLDRVRVY